MVSHLGGADNISVAFVFTGAEQHRSRAHRGTAHLKIEIPERRCNANTFPFAAGNRGDPGLLGVVGPRSGCPGFWERGWGCGGSPLFSPISREAENCAGKRLGPPQSPAEFEKPALRQDWPSLLGFSRAQQFSG